jgi:hypothetical protein
MRCAPTMPRCWSSGARQLRAPQGRARRPQRSSALRTQRHQARGTHLCRTICLPCRAGAVARALFLIQRPWLATLEAAQPWAAQPLHPSATRQGCTCKAGTALRLQESSTCSTGAVPRGLGLGKCRPVTLDPSPRWDRGPAGVALLRPKRAQQHRQLRTPPPRWAPPLQRLALRSLGTHSRPPAPPQLAWATLPAAAAAWRRRWTAEASSLRPAGTPGPRAC